MGIGELGFTLSTGVIAFHFGLVHYDPTGLVNVLRSKYTDDKRQIQHSS